jgi:hypothetical protein
VNTNYIHAAESPRKSRYPITSFRDRDDWLELLLAEDQLSLGAKVVGARIALHHNVETGQCNPKIGTLVLGTRMSESTVRRRIDELEVTGWLRVDRTLGRHSNSYEVRVPTLSDVTGFNPVSRDRVQNAPTLSTVTPQPCQNQPTPVTADTQNNESITAKRTAKDRLSRQPDLAEEDSRRRSQSPSATTETKVDADFEEFYRCYPRHAAKAAALKAYRAVIAKGLATPEELLSGAMRYAAERGREDPRYTKHPATWLNGGCWNDEPAKPIGNTIDVDGNPVRPPPDRQQRAASPTWMDIAMAGLDRGRL